MAHAPSAPGFPTPAPPGPVVRTLPADAHRDDAIWQRERRSIFAREWCPPTHENGVAAFQRGWRTALAER